MNINWRDLALRALHTFGASFVVIFGGVYPSIHTGPVVDFESAKRYVVAVLGAAAAAAWPALRITAQAAWQAVVNRGKWDQASVNAALTQLAQDAAPLLPLPVDHLPPVTPPAA